MSVHIEWMEAGKARAGAARYGETMGDGQQVTEDFAITFDMDEAVVIEGTEAQLRVLLRKAWAALDEKTKSPRRQS